MTFTKIKYLDHGFEVGIAIVLDNGKLRRAIVSDSPYNWATVCEIIDKDTFNCLTNNLEIFELNPENKINRIKAALRETNKRIEYDLKVQKIYQDELKELLKDE